MNHEVKELIVPLQLDASELSDLRYLRAAQGYTELGMYEEADAEVAKVSPASRLFRLFVWAGVPLGSADWRLADKGSFSADSNLLG